MGIRGIKGGLSCDITISCHSELVSVPERSGGPRSESHTEGVILNEAKNPGKHSNRLKHILHSRIQLHISHIDKI